MFIPSVKLAHHHSVLSNKVNLLSSHDMIRVVMISNRAASDDLLMLSDD